MCIQATAVVQVPVASNRPSAISRMPPIRVTRRACRLKNAMTLKVRSNNAATIRNVMIRVVPPARHHGGDRRVLAVWFAPASLEAAMSANRF